MEDLHQDVIESLVKHIDELHEINTSLNDKVKELELKLRKFEEMMVTESNKRKRMKEEIQQVKVAYSHMESQKPISKNNNWRGKWMDVLMTIFIVGLLVLAVLVGSISMVMQMVFRFIQEDRLIGAVNLRKCSVLCVMYCV
ncbi:unnamed protein product [Cuscuta epithymum]|uniref:Uncharacterized protein n=1 Tax=Cuscuta epithymum TaxID=186058 RepID=A0AAV0CPW7_9ASTE|nr:unnamed protein product [Cuscuta epithymum]